MPYDNKTSRPGGLMVAITKATDDGRAQRGRAMPGMDGIALLIKGKKRSEMERGEVQAMLLDLAKASIKAHEEKDAARIAEVWQLAHNILCESHMAGGDTEPEGAED